MNTLKIVVTDILIAIIKKTLTTKESSHEANIVMLLCIPAVVLEQIELLATHRMLQQSMLSCMTCMQPGT